VRRPVAYATVVLVLLAFRAHKLRVNRMKRAAMAFSLFVAVAATAHAAPVAANERAAVRGSFGIPRFRAVAFDSFVLFNPDSIVATAESIFPGHGRELTTSWRTRHACRFSTRRSTS